MHYLIFWYIAVSNLAQGLFIAHYYSISLMHYSACQHIQWEYPRGEAISLHLQDHLSFQHVQIQPEADAARISLSCTKSNFQFFMLQKFTRVSPPWKSHCNGSWDCIFNLFFPQIKKGITSNKYLSVLVLSRNCFHQLENSVHLSHLINWFWLTKATAETITVLC